MEIKKSFVFFQSTEGGMETLLFSKKEEVVIGPGWMLSDCQFYDKGLLEWMDTADVGDFCNHRLGVMVRLKDIKERDKNEN